MSARHACTFDTTYHSDKTKLRGGGGVEGGTRGMSVDVEYVFRRIRTPG